MQDRRQIEAGVIQRVTALNLFLHDVYHAQRALKDGIVPRDLVLGNANYRPEMQDFDAPCGTYVHICGIDIVRDDAGRFMVLEDNGRTPSGVSYVVENRRIMQRTFPDLIDVFIQPVEDYGLRLGQAMAAIAPAGVASPQIALLSPGIFNSAYFEHVFLAREMGVPLVEGREHGRQVSRPLHGRARGVADADAKFASDDGGKGGLAETGGSIQEHVVRRLTATPRRLQQNAEIGLDFPLADVLAQRPRPERALHGQVRDPSRLWRQDPTDLVAHRRRVYHAPLLISHGCSTCGSQRGRPVAPSRPGFAKLPAVLYSRSRLRRAAFTRSSRLASRADSAMAARDAPRASARE